MRKLLLLWALALFTMVPAFALPGSGAKYGSRDPRTCQPSTSSTAPTAEQARQLFICDTELDVNDTLYLVENVTIQVAQSSRAIQPGDSYNDIDQSKPVFPIRGSFTEYSCGKVFNVDASHTNAGKNCSVLQQPHAQGICYKSTFGEWVCRMKDPTVGWSSAQTGVAPPK